MFPYRRRNDPWKAVRIVLILFIGLGMPTALLGPRPAAAAVFTSDIVARLQLHFDTLTIHDDREGWLSGQGEFSLGAAIWRCAAGAPPPCLDQHENNAGEAKSITYWGTTQWGFTGDVITLDRMVPSAPTGFAIYPGKQYVLRVHMTEEDEVHINTGEDMGTAYFVLDTGEHGLGIGTHTVRSVRSDGVKQGDFSLTFEVRRAQVPDLRASGITIQHPPTNALDQVCIGVTNHELYDAGPFDVHLLIDGSLPPGGRFRLDGLKGGTGTSVCADVQLPTAGPHAIAASVDALGMIADYDGTNNYFEMEYRPGTPKTGQPEPNKPYADLSVSAIKLNGQVPDGKDDCKNGKNSVVVTLKLTGKGASDLFTTRLTVDGVDVAEVSRVGLEPGQEHELRFDGVQLKKGDHPLTATVDANSQIPETNEGNNALTVNARCSG